MHTQSVNDMGNTILAVITLTAWYFAGPISTLETLANALQSILR